MVLPVIYVQAQEEIGGDKYFKYGRFEEALPIFLEDVKKAANDVDLQYKIGICYIETNIDKSEAIGYFEFAQNNGKKGNDLIFYLGQAYFYANRFDDALAKFNEYRNLESKNSTAVSIADKYIAFCNNAKTFTAKPLKVTFENLGNKVNSPKSDFCPYMDFSEAYILFSSNAKYVAEFGEYVTDVNTTEFKNGKWKRGKSVSSKINSSIDNEYIVGSMPNLEAIIIRPDSYDYSGDLLIAYSDGKRLGAPVNPGNMINGEKSFESSGCLSVTGDTMYFASDRPGGFGGSDIYYSIRFGDNWGVPQNLGATINTPYNEDFPSMSEDGKTFYFASEGLNSMGGFDIFVTKLNPTTMEWSTPKNLGYPINTTYDDYNITMSRTGRYGFVSQVKKDGEGEYDLYKVIFADKDPYYQTYTGLVATGDTASYTPILNLTKNVKIQVISKSDNSVFGEYKLSSSSKYTISLPPGEYFFKINAEGFPEIKKTINVPEIKPKESVSILDMFIDAGDTAKNK